MGPTHINGLPAHPLLVHAVVGLVPLAAILVVVAAVWPAARVRLGVVPPLVALAALVSIPPTTHAGEALEHDLGVENPLVEKHAHLGDQLLPWVAVLFVVAAVAWFLMRRPATPRALHAVTAVVAVVVAVGSTWMTYRIGDSGAKAVWDGVGASRS
ncbi:hypothetical protein CLV35_0747 [Motilibacter peucedani]|uniref:DUF2231 domain-containing protein n=1 Tax=Motilibacter peucedani TaxID=598650 RepID=A0A420XUJ1_9ACTN|nr:DUF2231 domain-containing protein [Motilibacter peucedani]RKS80319.1 hypothetical protein CLV35_0747 [Motilibacter peucedani]